MLKNLQSAEDKCERLGCISVIDNCDVRVGMTALPLMFMSLTR